MPMAEKKMTVEVFRYDPDAAGGETRFDSYEVPYQSEWVVLDALNWIKDEVDGSRPIDTPLIEIDVISLQSFHLSLLIYSLLFR